ncbi:Translation initiation factor IF-2 [Frankliniella fusca]|uniref:Translation initiation factor IF-2 n=1 Tax=Frankliniella fusca TaxID=407009 RepID=A0AAE1GW80_9NEOP|nr:Translation initiation factor IF-2 [Frankliniella fusca]
MHRLEFLLVFIDDPTAADVVREDFIVSREDDKCVFRWVKNARKDPVGEPVSGRILREGLKKDLSVLKVDISGTITQAGEGLGTRKQELEKARLKAAHAQANNLQELAEDMLRGGPDSNVIRDPSDELSQQLHPTTRAKRPKTPKKRTPAQIAHVKEQLNNMPCFQNGPNKIELWEGKGVYCPDGFLTTARLRYGLQPQSLFRTILRILFPPRFRLLDGVSFSGKSSTVAVSSNLIESIVLYVQGVFRMNGGVVEDIKINPQAIVTNLICNTRKKHNINVNDLPPTDNSLDLDLDLETDDHLEETAAEQGTEIAERRAEQRAEQTAERTSNTATPPPRSGPLQTPQTPQTPQTFQTLQTLQILPRTPTSFQTEHGST